MPRTLASTGCYVPRSTGGWNARYKATKERRMVDELVARVEARVPYCRIRYAF